jgi:hypothetical protein
VLPWRVFSDEAVDRLADEVGVPDVPGVLLDHVHQETPQWVFTSDDRSPRVTAWVICT